MTAIECPEKPIKISWTGLLRHEECPRRDHLIRQGLRDDRNVDQRVFLLGNVVDNAMRAWLDQDSPVLGDLIPRAEPMVDSYVQSLKDENKLLRWKDNGDRGRVIRDAEEALARLEPWLWENIIPHPYQPEARGHVQIQVPDQTGNIRPIRLFYATDILVKPENFTIYDLKTTRNEQYIRGKTLGQLTFYAIGIAARFGIPLREVTKLAFLTPLCRDIETTVYPTSDDFRIMVQRITRYAQAVWAGYYPTKLARDSVCQYRCEVKAHCPLGQDPKPDSSGRVDFAAVARMRKASKPAVSDATEDGLVQ